MNVINEIQYINESLLLAIFIFSSETKVLDDIDFDKLNISKEEYFSKYKKMHQYYKKIVDRAYPLKEKYSNIKDLFLVRKGKTSIFSTLIYSKRKESISDYTYEEFRDMVKKVILENAESRLGETEKDLSEIDLIDKIDYLDGSQKFALVKLFDESRNEMADLYNLLKDLENIIREEIQEITSLISEQLGKIDMDFLRKYKNFQTFEQGKMFAKFDTLNVFPLINNFHDMGISAELDDDGKYHAYIIIGFSWIILQDYRPDFENRFNDMQETLSVIAEANRFKIIHLLAKKTMFGQEIADELNLSKGSVSQHLGHLQEKNIVSFSIDGRKIYYDLNKSSIKEIINYFNDLIGVKDE
ncbi:metalloregulator ArsR/SmtB family transcription factor [uncultured Helcococcus sp.]|uniref:ArsR/SmtB family transcription factor n=1 Tax=uncultured Helcococcus sp. TaxID=1072508 RepID=UPI00288A7C12|nr:metalloregulator ArsR/SmtB family transcription factor [uncultured Helcococcus sp.]